MYIQCIILHRVPQIAILRYAVNIDKFSMDMYFDEVYGFIFALVPEVKNRTGCEVQCNKGIRDAGSTADLRILFEILKLKNLEICKISKNLEHLKNFRTFGKFEKSFF